jgi:hypothetical protein
VIGGRAKPSGLRISADASKKKVVDLSDMEEDGIFAVYGVVTAIVQGQEWWYPVCVTDLSFLTRRLTIVMDHLSMFSKLCQDMVSTIILMMLQRYGIYFHR